MKTVKYTLPAAMAMAMAQPVVIESSIDTDRFLNVGFSAPMGVSETKQMKSSGETLSSSGSGTYSISAPLDMAEWKGSDERKFMDLVRKEALETATDEELVHLEELSKIRSRKREKLTLKEIILRRRQREAELNLVAALSAFLTIAKPYGGKGYTNQG